MIRRIVLLAVVAMLVAVFPATGAGATGEHPALTPEEVTQVVLPGTQFDVEKTVHTPELPPEPEIYFLVDTTGSMTSVINQVKTDIGLIIGSVLGPAPLAEFGLGEYKDFPFDPFAFNHRVSIGPDDGVGGAFDVSDDVAALFASGGSDGSEGQFFALDQLAEAGNPAGFTPGKSNIIVWIGDAPAHDSVCMAISALGYDITEASVTAKLGAPVWGGNGLTTVAVSTTTGFPAGLDDDPTLSAFDYGPFCAIGGVAGQASRITAATGGTALLNVPPNQVAQAILAAIGAVQVDVAMTSDCADPISVNFAPPVQTVTSGDDAVFTETISVADDAAPGVYHCRDWALIDGSPMTDPATGEIIFEEKWITVAEPFCREGVNPDGQTPQAPGTGQNEDGFYFVGADPEEAGLSVEVIDSGTGTVFGPFPTTTNIKYTEANGATPSIKPGPGAVDWRIKGQGDALVKFTDDFGNMATVACLVPPPPK